MAIDDLLSILSDYINDRDTDVVFLKELITLAKAHQLEGIVYYKTKSIENKQSYLKSVSDYVNRKQLLNQLISGFEAESISFFLVKGVYVAPHYPVPALRTMGDCDIVVRPEDKERAAFVFERLGFVDKTHNRDYEWVYYKNGYEFELHHSLFYEKDMYEIKEKDLLVKAWLYVMNSNLDPNFHFIYLLSHIKKHLLNCGIGFRQFMDLAIEIKYGGVNGNYIKELAEQAGLLKFAGVCLALCERWFNIGVPFKEPISEEFYTYATEKIANNGVFGYDDKENQTTGIENRVSHDGKIQSLLDAVFLPYENFLKLDGYGWLKNKKWLLPFAWIHRLLKKVFSSEARKKGVKTIQDIASTDVNQVKSVLSEWGL